jgi:dipeptidyl aminopeptidase/acylaminoacyl peptidase
MRLPGHLLAGLLVLRVAPLSAQAAAPAARRPIALEDLLRLRAVSSPRISPDGRWVAYTVKTATLRTDSDPGDIWMASWDGRRNVRLTWTDTENEHSPRWSPDGRRLAFLSDRPGDTGSGTDQLWILDIDGGEARQVTSIKQGVDDFAWSPDGSHMALEIQDPDSVEPGAGDSLWRKTPRPIVIDRYYFKEDYVGFLGRRRKHLYLYDLADRQLQQLTSGNFDDLEPAWSPDGHYLAFASKRQGADPDRHDNYDVYVIQAEPGAVPRQLTTFEGPEAHPDWGSPPAWSPDAHSIAFLQGGLDRLIYYANHDLAVIPWGGGTTQVLSQGLDRNVDRPEWAPDGRSVYGILEDDRAHHLAQFGLTGGAPRIIVGGPRVVSDYSVSRQGRIAVLFAQDDCPSEVYAVDDSGVRNLSHQNDSLLATLDLAPVEELTARSRDGTQVHGLLVRPLHAEAGHPYPTILRIHGGPVYQFEHEFDLFWQLLASRGYAVVAMNPRGSSGRGQKYALAIWADWGDKDAQDVLAGLDEAVHMGVADPGLLGVGGWSYGGILTNYVIAQDSRFLAAVSGASISDILAGYGTDMYVREYEAELGPPWKNPDTWLKLSTPFLHADRIHTPTLFMAGDQDANVPLLNSEQMYQALRSLGVPTELVVYPGQYHGIDKPSYQLDRYRRWLDWYGRYLRR